jgi:hypothetical protein
MKSKNNGRAKLIINAQGVGGRKTLQTS